MEIIKKLLFLFIILMSFACAFVIYIKPSTAPISNIQAPQNEELKTALPIGTQVPSIISEINLRNSNITSFACEDVIIKAWQKGIRIRLTANLYCEKDKNFHIVAKSIVNKEFEMGSNATHFWFWSKRMEPQALYFAKHEDYYKTRLKTPFDPKLIQQSLMFHTIDVSKSKIVELQDKYIIVDNTINSINQPICRFTYINKQLKRIDGFLVVDINGKNIVSSEVTEWDENIPKQILYVWFDEGISMLIDLKNPQLNANINKSNWIMPSITPQIDMGLDSTNCYLKE